MAKVLMVDPAKCTGCKMCELACSMAQRGYFSPAESQIRVSVFTEEACYIPVVCLQCDPAPCMQICPSGALTRNRATGAVVVNEQKCIACKMCMIACPFGTMSFCGAEGHAAKCNLCSGDPMCVAFCGPGALTYREAEVSVEGRQKATAMRLMKSMLEAV